MSKSLSLARHSAHAALNASAFLSTRLTSRTNKKEQIARVFPQVIAKLTDAPEPPLLDSVAIDIWLSTNSEDLGLLAKIARHLDPHHVPLFVDREILDRLFSKYRLADKRIRVPAIRAIAHIVGTACRHPKYKVQAAVLEQVLRDLRQAQRSDKANVKAAAIMLLGALGTAVPEELTGEVLEMLLLQLGEGEAVMALASTEVR